MLNFKKPMPLNQRWLKYSKSARRIEPFISVFISLSIKQQIFILLLFWKIDNSLLLDKQIDILEATKYDKAIDITAFLKEFNLYLRPKQIGIALQYIRYSFWLDKETPINPPKESPLYGKKSIVIKQPLFYQLIYVITGDPGKQRQYCFYKINPLFINYFGSTIQKNFAFLKLEKIRSIKNQLTIIFNWLINKIFNPYRKTFNIKVEEFLAIFKKEPEQLKKLLFIINSKVIPTTNQLQTKIKVIKVSKNHDHIQITMHHKYLDPNFRKKLN